MSTGCIGTVATSRKRSVKKGREGDASPAGARHTGVPLPASAPRSRPPNARAQTHPDAHLGSRPGPEKHLKGKLPPTDGSVVLEPVVVAFAEDWSTNALCRVTTVMGPVSDRAVLIPGGPVVDWCRAVPLQLVGECAAFLRTRFAPMQTRIHTHAYTSMRFVGITAGVGLCQRKHAAYWHGTSTSMDVTRT